MYIPKHFKIDNDEEIYEFIEENSFATLFSKHDGGSVENLKVDFGRNASFIKSRKNYHHKK